VSSPPPVLAGQSSLLAIVAAGGALGSLARWGAGLALPTGPDGFPWTTLGINVLGSLLIGALIALVADAGTGRRAAHPLARPFLGTGVLGGFTTFSGYAVEGQQLLLGARYAAAAGYLLGTAGAALLAAWAGLALVRLVAGSRP
jgi:CrcB protein